MKDSGYYQALKEFKSVIGDRIIYISDEEFGKIEKDPYTFSFSGGGFHYVRESEKNI